jgi:hypothetical protein
MYQKSGQISKDAPHTLPMNPKIFIYTPKPTAKAGSPITVSLKNEAPKYPIAKAMVQNVFSAQALMIPKIISNGGMVMDHHPLPLINTKYITSFEYAEPSKALRVPAQVSHVPPEGIGILIPLLSVPPRTDLFLQPQGSDNGEKKTRKLPKIARTKGKN